MDLYDTRFLEHEVRKNINKTWRLHGRKVVLDEIKKIPRHMQEQAIINVVRFNSSPFDLVEMVRSSKNLRNAAKAKEKRQ